jgi:hypothetical protein
LFLKIATLSPAPSLEVEEALHHAACKLLKMAYRCPEWEGVGGSRWSAKGYFAILGELALAFAYGQKHREELRPLKDDSRVRKLFQQLSEELISPAKTPPARPDAWPGDFDWLIRDVANLALLSLAPQIRTTHKAYAAACRELQLDSRIAASRPPSYAPLVVAASWLDAFGRVLDTYERYVV